jgi:lipopolysaccharide/colanic/teichoic acid biosynthesis glycosyltransferase
MPGTLPSPPSVVVGHGLREYLRASSKRATDVVLAAVMLILLAPFFVLTAIAIRLDSRGPMLFRQRRVGRGGQQFTMLKFRSMSAQATSEAHHLYVTQLATGVVDTARGDLQKLTDDPRVTRVGAIIRKASIDEWPQLFNVLAGQMSIVGPRPAVWYELELYRPEHFARLSVRPGITGLWQVSGRNRLGFNEMLDLDVEYVRRHGFVLDIWLMLRTPLAVFRADTA